MCTCRLSLSYLSSESMPIWNLRFPAFVASYKRAELQRLRRPETHVKLYFFVNSRLLLPKKSSQLEMYLILPNFLNLMYVRSVTWCACFLWICIVCAFVTSMNLQLWGVIGEMVPKNVVPWIVYVFGPLVRITDGFSVVCETLEF